YFPFYARQHTGWTCAVADHSSFEEFCVERDGHFVPDQNATGLKRRVPGQTEVFAVDLCGRGCRNPGTAPRIFRRRGWPVNVKNRLAGYAPNRQVSLDGQFTVPNKADARGLERKRGELLHMEEVGALQVRIALGVAGFDRGRFD